MTKTKQIIVVRRDLNMSHGKMAAQVAHASMSFLTRDGRMRDSHSSYSWSEFVCDSDEVDRFIVAIADWLSNSFTKVVLGVDTLEQLLEVKERAEEANLMNYLVVDSGKTVFNGVDTPTCLAIGPHWNEDFENITSQLKLY